MTKKNFIKVKIAPVRYDRCLDCPLLGRIDKSLRPKGSLETYICIPTRHAMTSRLIRSRVSEADAKHPRHRYCEKLWDAWQRLPNREVMIPVRAYIEERLPLEASLQLPIIFHNDRKKWLMEWGVGSADTPFFMSPYQRILNILQFKLYLHFKFRVMAKKRNIKI